MKRLLLAALLLSTHALADENVVVLGKIHSYSEADVYDVWCEPHAPTCTYNGEEVSRPYLALVMPQAKWGYCRAEFCYGDKNLSDVIGLNPTQGR